MGDLGMELQEGLVLRGKGELSLRDRNRNEVSSSSPAIHTLNSGNPGSSATSQQILVPVPADLIQSLIQTVDSLKLDVAKLQKDNAALTRQVGYINSDVKFPRFTEFPSEIQDLIWTFALTIPQIHIISDKGASLSQINRFGGWDDTIHSLMENLRFSFIHASEKWLMDFEPSGNPCGPNVVNHALDTIWFRNGGLPAVENLVSHCFSCEVSLMGEPLTDPEEMEKERVCGHKRELAILAVNLIEWQQWKSPLTPGFVEYEPAPTKGAVEALWEYGNTREVYIVLGGEDLPDNVEVEFRNPDPDEQGPREFMQQLLRNERGHTALRAKFGSAVPLDSWEKLEKYVRDELERNKKEMVSMRSRILADKKISKKVREKALEKCPDISWWKVPKVRFVKVKAKGSLWMSTAAGYQ